jgi:D-glycero-D-manno-heptose 1,7-bisphosphate phosphatase
MRLASGIPRPRRTAQRKRRAVFLDRDGVINRCDVRQGKPYAPRAAKDFRLLPGVPAAVRALKSAGLLVVVVTNQPDIGNGLVSESIVEAMHDKLRSALPVDDLRVCPHSQSAGCDCRKPKPGMLIDAARDLNIDLKRSFIVGDRSGDIVAGEAVGCYTLFIDRRYTEPRPKQPDQRVRSLPSAVKTILSLL